MVPDEFLDHLQAGVGKEVQLVIGENGRLVERPHRQAPSSNSAENDDECKLLPALGVDEMEYEPDEPEAPDPFDN